MKNIVSRDWDVKFDNEIFNMSVVEFEIVGLFESCIIKNEINKLWVRLLKLFNNNQKIELIINANKKGAISMIECESMILLFARHDQEIWNNFSEDFRLSTRFKAPIEMVNNVLNINYEEYKLSVSELKFIAKIMRLNKDISYSDFHKIDATSFKNLLVVKTFFMKNAILKDYSEKEYLDNINDLKIKTVKDLICIFLQRKIIKKN